MPRNGSGESLSENQAAMNYKELHIGYKVQAYEEIFSPSNSGSKSICRYVEQVPASNQFPRQLPVK